MLTDEDHAAAAQSTPDPLWPLCGDEEFAAVTAELIAREAPRLFALVQEFGERADGRVAAWGLAFDGYAEVVGVGRGPRWSVRSPESAVRWFTTGEHVSARVVWCDPSGPPALETVWGHTILEPDRGHVRDAVATVVDGIKVGLAVCGAFLIGDLPNQDGAFPKCSACVIALGDGS